MILLCFGFSVAVKPQNKNGEQWKEFTSKEGQFSVLLPGAPLDERTEKDLRFRLNDGPRVYGVALLTEYEKGTTPDKTLEDLANKFVQSSQSRLIEKTPITLKKYPGLAVKLETPDPPGTTQLNYYLVEDKLFVLITFTRDGNSEEFADKFLKSFRLLKK